MRQHKHLSRENFDQHISEVNSYMNKVDGSLSDNRGWDAMTCELVESLRENHTGSFELSDVFERTMNTVWDRILYDSSFCSMACFAKGNLPCKHNCVSSTVVAPCNVVSLCNRAGHLGLGILQKEDG